ncbi:hypothetical protein LINGRAHAP2_LOCUS13984 [Linum grandiflorum]
MFNAFSWGTKRVAGNGIPWRSWERLAVCKEVGGLGFRDLRGFNLARSENKLGALCHSPHH